MFYHAKSFVFYNVRRRLGQNDIYIGSLETRLQSAGAKRPLHSLVENMAKKNRNRFPIVVLLTIMLCGR